MMGERVHCISIAGLAVELTGYQDFLNSILNAHEACQTLAFCGTIDFTYCASHII